MKYALLIYDNPGSFEALARGRASRSTQSTWRYREDPRCVGGAQLQPIETATTVRVEDGQTLTTDGPFADTKEVFGGYYIVRGGRPRRGDRGGLADPGSAHGRHGRGAPAVRR